MWLGVCRVGEVRGDSLSMFNLNGSNACWQVWGEGLKIEVLLLSQKKDETSLCLTSQALIKTMVGEIKQLPRKIMIALQKYKRYGKEVANFKEKTKDLKVKKMLNS